MMNRIAMSFVLLAVSALWVYRDAAFGDLCPTKVDACKGNATVPCSGSKDCVLVSSGDVPGGTTQCLQPAETAGAWRGEPPASWIDCATVGQSGTGSDCTRSAMVCLTVRLYETENDCNDPMAIPCNTDKVDECTANQGQPCI